MKLYSYWRSSASYRVRIALNLKAIDYEYIPVHLVKEGGQQHSAEYQAVNPAQLVPALVDEEHNLTLSQSMAIVEYLDEAYPDTLPLVRGDAINKALIRTIAYDIGCDIQPIANLRVLNYVANDLGAGDEKKVEWAKHWIHTGLDALEKRLEKSAGNFCVGDDVSLADVCLLPQAYNAQRFKVELSDYPNIHRVVEHCNKQQAFIDALPENQPDAM